MVCSEPFVEPCIKAILSSARTGEVGDGKIFVQPIERVIRIRTGEQNNEALTAVNADGGGQAAPRGAAGEWNPGVTRGGPARTGLGCRRRGGSACSSAGACGSTNP